MIVDIVLIMAYFTNLNVLGSPNPDLTKNVTQIIQSRGYNVIEYDVVTPDGYILGVQRIPYSKNVRDGPPNSKVALCHHGLLGSSLHFLSNYENNSLGYFLADHGYDVWLTNTRGNIYSKRHLNLSSDSPKFWNFTMDDFALTDLPTVIDFILNNTSQKQLTYFGYSMGSTVSLMLLSTKLEYNDKIKLAVYLAPVGEVKYITTPLRNVSPWSSVIPEASVTLGNSGEFSEGYALRDAALQQCNTMPETCPKLFGDISGTSLDYLNKSQLAFYIQHSDDGISLLAFSHYGQMIETGKLHRYIKAKPLDSFSDFLTDINIEPTPEDIYNISKISCPTALYWSSDDLDADFHDVHNLRHSLQASVVVEDYRVTIKPAEPFQMDKVDAERQSLIDDSKNILDDSLKIDNDSRDKQWTHVAFIYAENPRDLLYTPILKLLEKYN